MLNEFTYVFGRSQFLVDILKGIVANDMNVAIERERTTFSFEAVVEFSLDLICRTTSSPYSA